jgi:SAM-dependent methyltransferase
MPAPGTPSGPATSGFPSRGFSSRGGPSPLQREPRKRTPLSAPSLSFQREGDPDAAERLRSALAVPPLPEQVAPRDRDLYESSLHIHLFHSFAGRTHPLLVRRLIADLGSPPGAAILDPFVGSGTVLVEATRAGKRGIGYDVNPLAVRLAHFKATPMPPPMQEALFDCAAAVAEASLDRVQTRLRPSHYWDSASHFAPHVYLELCGLRQEIAQVVLTDPPLGEAMLLIFSSLIIKATQQRSELPAEGNERRIGRGLVSRWFVAKAEEVARLHAALWEQTGARGPLPPPPLCIEGDARKLSPSQPLRDGKRAGGGAKSPLWEGSIDAVITSPPYLGTYDYADHHARRFAWLDLDPQLFRRSEMAARRHASEGGVGRLREQHQRDSIDWVSAMARLLKPGGRLYVLVGDSVVSHQPLRGDSPIRFAAEQSGLRFIARAAAERPNYYRSASSELPPRLEHLLEFHK